MIHISLGDKHSIENFKAIHELRKTGMYSDEELQQLYDRQVEIDREKEGDEE